LLNTAFAAYFLCKASLEEKCPGQADCTI